MILCSNHPFPGLCMLMLAYATNKLLDFPCPQHALSKTSFGPVFVDRSQFEYVRPSHRKVADVGKCAESSYVHILPHFHYDERSTKKDLCCVEAARKKKTNKRVFAASVDVARN